MNKKGSFVKYVLLSIPVQVSFFINTHEPAPVYLSGAGSMVKRIAEWPCYVALGVK